MIICGIDYSITSPAVVRATLDDDFEVTDIQYISFNSTKKMCKANANIFYTAKKFYSNDFERFYDLRDKVRDFIYDGDSPSYVAIEGYAMGGKGKVFNIAEATFLTKSEIYTHGTPLRIYTPSMIKKYATTKGDAGKVSMWEAFIKDNDPLIDLSHLPDLRNPKEDIIDAYYIMKLLQFELKLRNGIVSLRDLTPKQIEIFNGVSKANPVNLLVRDFIVKQEEE